MRVLETIRRSLLPTLAVGTMLVSERLSAQPTTPVTFEQLSYKSPAGACDWNGQTIQNGFSGFSWSGLSALDLREYLYSSDNRQTQGQCFVDGRQGSFYKIQNDQTLTGYASKYTGYNSQSTQVVAISGSSGPNGANFSSSSLFELKSMQLGAGWGNVLSLSVSGWNNGTLVWAQPFSFLGRPESPDFPPPGHPSAPKTLSAQSGLINEVRFDATYETIATNYDPYGTIAELAGYGEDIISKPGIGPYRTFWIDNIDIQTARISTVPEPGTWALMATGLLGLGVAARRRRKS